jgi:hypothetical protein
LSARQRQRPHAEAHIRNDTDTGLRNLPFRDFEHNRVWLMLVLLAHDLIAWVQRLLLTGELASCEPKRLRYGCLVLTSSKEAQSGTLDDCSSKSAAPVIVAPPSVTMRDLPDTHAASSTLKSQAATSNSAHHECCMWCASAAHHSFQPAGRITSRTGKCLQIGMLW